MRGEIREMGRDTEGNKYKHGRVRWGLKIILKSRVLVVTGGTGQANQAPGNEIVHH